MSNSTTPRGVEDLSSDTSIPGRNILESRISRRALLRAGLTASAGVAVFPEILSACAQTPSIAGGSVKSGTFKMPWVNPDAWSGTHAAELLRDQIVKRSKGAIEVQWFPNGSLAGSEDSMMRGMLAGQWEFAAVSSQNISTYTTSFLPLDMPFLVRNIDEAEKLVRGPVRDLWDQDLKDHGMQLIALLPFGFRELVTSGPPIHSPDALKGKKIRTTGDPIQQDLFKAWGATPVPLDFLETFTALQQHVVIGDTVPTEFAVVSKYYEVTNSITLNRHQWIYYIVPMRKESFDSLTPDLQKAILDAGDDAEKFQVSALKEADSTAVSKLTSAGMTVYEPTSDEMSNWHRSVKPVWDKWQGGLNAKVLSAVLTQLGRKAGDAYGA